MIDRRALLAAAATALSATALPAAARTATAIAPGLQLYTVRDAFAADPAGTLRRVAGIGYREVEFGGGGFMEMDASALRAALDAEGLTAPSAHFDMADLDGRPTEVLRVARALGCRTLVLPWIDADQRTADHWRALAPRLNAWGRWAQDEGLAFAYHNHDFEFAEVEGLIPMDHLLAETDPERVGFELDLYWAAAVGRDIAALVAAHLGRFGHFHLKDMDAQGRMADLGRGVLDFAALIRLGQAAGVRHMYVERDDAPAPWWPSLTTSRAHLARLGIG